MAPDKGVLFTAFEPSGDAVAAPVVAELKRQRPQLRVWAVGGAKMRAAGAEVIEDPTSRAVMLADVARVALEHRQRVRRLREWLAGHAIAAHVPVDSPAANWGICKLVRRMQPQAAVVHLVAPQLWAWGTWRTAKLRRLTNHVLCLLPFEPAWFGRRGVAGTFVGHPLLDRAMDPPAEPAMTERATRLALLPGSRRGELKANWPTMLAAYRQLERRHPGLTGQVAAIDADAEGALREMSRDGADWPASLEVKVGQVAAVLKDSESALVVSGTATLDAVAAGTPLVVLYNTNRVLYWLVRWWAIRTKTFALPNLISEARGWGRVCAELVPHYGAVLPVVEEVDALLTDPRRRQRQKEAWQEIRGIYHRVAYAAPAAGKILEVAVL